MSGVLKGRGMLRLRLVMPSVNVGGMTPGMLAGVDLAGVLAAAGVLEGAPMQRGAEMVYALALPDGVEVAIPVSSGQGEGFMARMMGKQEVILGNDRGRLRLLVPNIPFVTPFITQALSSWSTTGPTPTMAGVAFWLRLVPGATLALPLGAVGKLGLEVPR